MFDRLTTDLAHYRRMLRVARQQTTLSFDRPPETQLQSGMLLLGMFLLFTLSAPLPGAILHRGHESW